MEKDTLVFRFIDGILNNESYMLLKRLATSCGGKALILPVSPDDYERISEMVTTSALYLNESNLQLINAGDEDSKVFEILVKKLCIAARYIISGFKSVVDYGDGKKEAPCTLSIVTPAAHIHIPQDTNDKKTERFISSALSEAARLLSEGICDYLIYFDDASGKTVCESKDDYVRRKYSASLKQE